MKKPKLPEKFSPMMRTMGTCMLSVGVKRVGWVPIAGTQAFCNRWVARQFGLRDNAEVTHSEWEEIDAFQKRIYELQRAAS